MAQIDALKFLVESQAFGVCERIGERLQMPAKNIRLFFIYTSCITVASPVIIYMILAFWMKMRDYVRARRTPVWDF
jgi:phage shock protein C